VPADFIEAAQEQRKRLLERLMQQNSTNQQAAAKVLGLLSAGRPSGSRSSMRPFVPFARPRMLPPGLLQQLGVVNNRIAGPTVTPPGLMNNPNAAPPAPAFQPQGVVPPGFQPEGIVPGGGPGYQPQGAVPLGGGAAAQQNPQAPITPPTLTTQDYIRSVGRTASGRVYGGRHVF
jgi:hypothetical protein